jgi:hypothetical protein
MRPLSDSRAVRAEAWRETGRAAPGATQGRAPARLASADRFAAAVATKRQREVRTGSNDAATGVNAALATSVAAATASTC